MIASGRQIGRLRLAARRPAASSGSGAWDSGPYVRAESCTQRRERPVRMAADRFHITFTSVCTPLQAVFLIVLLRSPAGRFSGRALSAALSAWLLHAQAPRSFSIECGLWGQGARHEPERQRECHRGRMPADGPAPMATRPPAPGVSAGARHGSEQVPNGRKESLGWNPRTSVGIGREHR